MTNKSLQSKSAIVPFVSAPQPPQIKPQVASAALPPSVIPGPVLRALGPYVKGKSSFMCLDNNIVVAKIGSNSLVREDGSVNQEYLNSVAHQCATLMKKYKIKILLVSSGACATGVHDMGLKEKPDGAIEKQALSAIGQVSIIHNWEEAFFPFNLRCAQLLLTQRAFTDFKSSNNFVATIKVLFKWNIIPIINENDPIAIKEITVGDNDRVASLLSTQLRAHTLVLLTDIDGFYDKNPLFHKDAKKLDEIPVVTAEMLNAAGGPGNKGRGGMRSKLESARFAAMGGSQVVIARASEPFVIERSVIKRDNMGTRIMPMPMDPDISDKVEEQQILRWKQCTAFIKDDLSKL